MTLTSNDERSNFSEVCIKVFSREGRNKVTALANAELNNIARMLMWM